MGKPHAGCPTDTTDWTSAKIRPARAPKGPGRPFSSQQGHVSQFGALAWKQARRPSPTPWVVTGKRAYFLPFFLATFLAAFFFFFAMVMAPCREHPNTNPRPIPRALLLKGPDDVPENGSDDSREDGVTEKATPHHRQCCEGFCRKLSREIYEDGRKFFSSAGAVRSQSARSSESQCFHRNALWRFAITTAQRRAAMANHHWRPDDRPSHQATCIAWRSPAHQRPAGS